MPIKARYRHTNLIARDWRSPVRFYYDVFGCTAKLPERHLSGIWLELLTSLPNVHLAGVHLTPPGFD